MQFIMFYNKTMLMIFEEVMLVSIGLSKVDVDFFKFLQKFMSKILFEKQLIKWFLMILYLFIFNGFTVRDSLTVHFYSVWMILFSSSPTLLIVTTLNSESTEFGRFGFSFDSSFETFVEDSDVFYMVKNFPIFFWIWKIFNKFYDFCKYLKIMEFPLWIRTK